MERCGGVTVQISSGILKLLDGMKFKDCPCIPSESCQQITRPFQTVTSQTYQEEGQTGENS